MKFFLEHQPFSLVLILYFIAALPGKRDLLKVKPSNTYVVDSGVYKPPTIIDPS
jgi:hypothetical protein